MSMDQEMEEILQLFFEESFEGLDTMESGLLTLDSSADRETINTIFRAAHSIKGGAGTFGFMEISGFTHSVETLLDEMRNGTRGITPDALQVLLQSVDVIREMVQSAQAKRPIVMVGATALSGELIRILAQKGVPVNSAAENAASNPPASAAPPAVLDVTVSQSAALRDKPDASPAAAAPNSVQTAAGGNLTGGALEAWRIVFEPDLSLFKTCNDP